MQQKYTVVCPGAGRFDEKQRDKMKKDDKRLHGGCGWETFQKPPIKCPRCGDEAQVRGTYMEVELSALHSTVEA